MTNVVCFAIWCHLYNLKNVKNAHGGVLILLKLTPLHGCFSRFLNGTNGTKSRNAPQIIVFSTQQHSQNVSLSNSLFFWKTKLLQRFSKGTTVRVWLCFTCLCRIFYDHDDVSSIPSACPHRPQPAKFLIFSWMSKWEDVYQLIRRS